MSSRRNIMPRENIFVSVFTNGEGWHNYHHCFPWDYKASEFGATNNFTTSFIEFFAKIGWATDLKVASDDMVTKRMSRTGDGSPCFSEKSKPGKFEKAQVCTDAEVMNAGW